MSTANTHAASRTDAGARPAFAYADYLRYEGACAAVIGASYVAMAFPGAINSYDGAWTALAWAPALLAVFAVFAAATRRGRLSAPGTWLTARPLGCARPDRRAADARRLRRTLHAEVAGWIAITLVWTVLLPSWSWWIFGTGWATLTYGVLQLAASCPIVRAAEDARGTTYYVARRPPLGVRTPELVDARRP